MKKMRKLRYSPEALNDLDEIWEYIHHELQNTDAAQKTVAGILDALEKLCGFPETGSLLSSITGNGRRDYLRILFDRLPRE